MLQNRIPETGQRAAREPGRSFRYSPDLAPGAVHVLELLGMATAGLGALAVPALQPGDYLSQHIFAVIFVVLVYAIMAKWAGLNNFNALMRPLARADNMIIAIMTTFLFLLTVLYGFDINYLFDSRWLGLFFAGSLTSVLGTRLAAFVFMRRLGRQRIIGRNLAVLGVGVQSARFLARLHRDPPFFTDVIGVFAADEAWEPAAAISPTMVLGGIDALLHHARAGLVDDVVVAMPWSADRTVIDTIEKLKELPVNVYLGSDLAGFDLAFRPVLGAFSQLPVYEVVQRPISGWSSALKKILDHVVATVALLILSPLLLLVALAIKLDSPGPVFFMQQRLGFNNKPFAIYKFRSMFHNRGDEAIVRQASRGDPRVTRVGRIIRATSIDELPQLLNVLNGTMSLVGPRPHALSHNEEYSRSIRGYFARHKVKPGITGWAQVNGLRGETVEIEKMRRRVEYDVYYAENWSILFDIKIIIMTAAVVLFQKTAY